MKTAQQRIDEDAREVTFDFFAPAVQVSHQDRERLAKNEDDEIDVDQVIPRAVRFVILQAVTSGFPGGMKRKDRRVWAAWQEAMEGDRLEKATVRFSQVEWLRKRMTDEDAQVPAPLAQWAEAVAEYLELLCLEPEATATDG